MPELLALGATSLNSSKTMVPMGWCPILTLKNTCRCTRPNTRGQHAEIRVTHQDGWHLHVGTAYQRVLAGSAFVPDWSHERQDLSLLHDI